MNHGRWRLAFLSGWLVVSLPLAGQTKKIRPLPGPRLPAPVLTPCPDVRVLAVSATLVGTQLGVAGIEFPTDTVRIDATLDNGGGAAVPPGTALHVEFRRNGQLLAGIDLTNALGAPNSRWTVSRTDTFPHGVVTAYAVAVDTPLAECQKGNNQGAVTVDEALLHAGGGAPPDLVCVMASAEKRWLHEGDALKGVCVFAADVRNVGAGYCRSDGKSLDLQFYSTANKSQPRGFVRIAKSELPGPGGKKRFSVEVPDTLVPPGKNTIIAFLPPADDEANKANNWSANAAGFDNAPPPALGGLARLRFPPWNMTGRILYVRVEIQNMQQQLIPGLRLMLLKNGAVVREWPGITLAAAATIEKVMTEDRPDAAGVTDTYKAVLTTNPSSPNPPAGQVLDSRTRPFSCLDLAAGLLLAMLQDPETGLGVAIERQQRDVDVFDDRTRVQITPALLSLQLEGNYRLKGGARVGWKARVGVTLRARNGSLVAEIVNKHFELGSKVAQAFLDILTVGIYEGIKYGIEKQVAKAISGSITLAGVGGVAPCGVALGDGALYIFYPYAH